MCIGPIDITSERSVSKLTVVLDFHPDAGRLFFESIRHGAPINGVRVAHGRIAEQMERHPTAGPKRAPNEYLARAIIRRVHGIAESDGRVRAVAVVRTDKATDKNGGPVSFGRYISFKKAADSEGRSLERGKGGVVRFGQRR
jgi:hypothetical protein